MTDGAAPPSLQLAFEGRVAVLTLSKPARNNAIDQAMWSALPDLIATVAERQEAAILIIRGEGGVFSAGADIAEFQTVFGTRQAASKAGTTIRAALQAVSRLEKPVIAAIRGYCIGGGCSLALSTDLRIASQDARFAIPPAKLGLVYSFDETRRLVEAVGPTRARDLLFTGRIIEAPEALSIGLVDRLAPADSFDDAVDALVASLLANAQGSIRGAKQMIQAVIDGATTETPRLRALADDAVASADFAEGYQAFLAKRRPDFSKR